MFRGQQEIMLKVMELSNGWHILGRRISSWANSVNAGTWLRTAPFAAFSSNGAAALRNAAEQGAIDGSAHITAGNAIKARDFKIFGVSVPNQGRWPWHQDWRFGYEWPPAYFRTYDHRTPRSQPYDVKFPWELSRLAFLLSLIQADVIDGGTSRTATAFEILEDWSANNPFAFSVNWYPMEAAMRGIGLCLISDMSRQTAIGRHEGALLLRLLAEHGEFIMRTIELTDNAGNHFTAELVALLLIGNTLQGTHPKARYWQTFAEKRIGHEILRQFLADGVNFEKSTAYHRLVLDLFLLASIVLTRSGCPLKRQELARLQAAAHYNAYFLRPDHLCPLIGDSDDAVVFAFENRLVRDHRPDLGIAALDFDDRELQAAAGKMPVSGFWLFG